MAYVAPGLVAETGTLSSGVVTVAGALTSPYTYRTFTSVLSDGDTISVVVADAQGDQAHYPNATWAESGGTLTLGSAAFSTGTITDGAVTVWAASNGAWIGGPTDVLLFGIACSDETTDLTTGQKAALDVPYDLVLTRIYVSVTTAASGANLQVDVEDEGTSLLNAVFGFQTNNAETSTFTGSASSYAMTKGDLLTIDVDQVGSTTAGVGLKVFFFGYRT